MAKRILITLFIVVLTLPLSSLAVAAGPVSNEVSDGLVVTRNDSIMEAKPASPAAAKIPPSVVITSPTENSEVSGTIDIIAYVTDDQGIKKVEYSIDDTGWIIMNTEDGHEYIASWDTTTVADESHEITVRATDSRNAKASASVSVTTNNDVEPPPPPPPPTATTYELDIEIDYIVGHEPTPEVLAYIQNYYNGNNPSGDVIDVTFTLDAIPMTGTDYDATDGVDTAEFWAIEHVYNGGADSAGGDVNNGVFDSENKWVLYGTTVEGSPGTVGYCYVVREVWPQLDGVYGNYIYVADETADNIDNYGAEAVVLMHELGHSIGIIVYRQGMELYDRDAGSVMSYVSYANVSLYGGWYYSTKYWDTRNLEYYEVVS